MAYKLSITNNAAAELDDILSYLSKYLDNSAAASDFLDKVEESFHRLSDNPKIYQLCDHRDFKEKGYRKVVIKNYIMIYRVDETTSTVYILHFFYGRRNYYEYL